MLVVLLPACKVAVPLHRPPPLAPPSHISPGRPASPSCGTLGAPCCHAPQSASNPAFGPLVHCGNALGCDIVEDKCVQPCGGVRQACCDGPETLAVKWTNKGTLYQPMVSAMGFRPMCDNGECDLQSHRCISCGVTLNSPCCPPDAQQATARCYGHDRLCEFDPPDDWVSGTCIQCGHIHDPPCSWGCEDDLEIRKGMCDVCGAEFQPPCDIGCRPLLKVAMGLCRHCGAADQIPCDAGCDDSLKVQNGKCEVCGGEDQKPCDAGCDDGRKLANGVCRSCGHKGLIPCDSGCDAPLEVIDGLCSLCGADTQKPCSKGCHPPLEVIDGFCSACGGVTEKPCVAGCNPPFKVLGGRCMKCGADGEVQCDAGCEPGLVLSGDICSQAPTQECAGSGSDCTTPYWGQPGPYCCRGYVCIYGHCSVCIADDQECTATLQTCCTPGWVCKFDQEKPNTLWGFCGIPDNPEGGAPSNP